MAVWVAVRSEGVTSDTVLYSLFTGGAWSPEGAVADCDGSLYAPSVAFATGAFMVAYERDGHYYARRFATAAGVWDAETRLDTATSQWFGPVRVASDGTGFAAVWGQDEGGVTRAMVSRFASGSWSTPVAVSAATDTADHQIAGNASGYGVVWRQGTSIFASIYASGTWGTAVEIDSGAPAAAPPASRPQIAAGATGYAVTWQQGSTTVNVYANVFNGSSWGGAVEIDGSSVSQASASPQIAGVASAYVVTWPRALSASPGNTATYASVYNGAWSSATSIDVAAAATALTPRVAANGSSFMVTWVKLDAPEGTVYATEYTGTWSTPIALDAATTPVGTPAIGCRGGSCVALWPQPAGATKSVFARRYSASSWGTAVNLVTHDYVGAAGTPKIAADAAGGRLAIWSQYRNGIQLLYGSFYAAGSWGAPFVIAGDDTTATQVIYASVASNGAGYMVVYKQDNDLYGRLYDGAAWGTPTLLEVGSAAPQMAFNGGLASNGSGYAVVWNQSDGVSANVFAGGAWGGATLLESLANAGSRAVIASNGTGYAAAWHQNDGTVNRIYGAVHDGVSWGAATPLEAGSGAAAEARIASDGSGYAVVWVQNDGSVASIYANVYAAGAWGGDALIEDGGEAATGARVAATAGGYLAAWVQSDGTASRVYAKPYRSGEWGAATILDDGSGDAGNPEVAASDGGYAVVWPRDDGGSTSFYANAYNGVWGTATRLDSAAADVAAKYRYELVAAGDGYCAVWTQPDPADTPNATTPRIWAAGF
jgi:hypothetical protein